jgi:hypothetical protein
MRTIYGLLLTAVMCGSVVGEEIWGQTSDTPTILDMVAMELNEEMNRNTSGINKFVGYHFSVGQLNTVYVSIYYDKAVPADFLEKRVTEAKLRVKSRTLVRSLMLYRRDKENMPHGLVKWVDNYLAADVTGDDRDEWLNKNSWVKPEVTRKKSSL